MADELSVDEIVNAHVAKQKEVTPGENQEKAKEGEGKPAEPAPITPEPPAPAPNPLADLLKEFEVDSIEALREKMKPKNPDKPESPEEKEKRENLYKASLIKYATEKGVMKPDDFTKLENLKAKDDKAMVYENWFAAWKEDNPDIDPEEAGRIAEEEFNAEYKLNSENEKARARGLAKIAKEAKEMRTPLESSYSTAKERYDAERELEKDAPDFDKKSNTFIQESIPEKYTVFKVKDGDEEVAIEETLTPEERREIFKQVAKDFASANTYGLYKKGELKALQALAKERAETLIQNTLRDRAAQKIANEFLTRGRKSAPGVGAKQPFPLVNDGKVQESGKKYASAKEEILDQPAFKA
jgi:hypothetical protein